MIKGIGFRVREVEVRLDHGYFSEINSAVLWLLIRFHINNYCAKLTYDLHTIVRIRT